MPNALITGINGQDGSYLAEFLLSKGYKIVGMSRCTSTLNFERIAHFQDEITLVQGDLHDQSLLVSILEEYEPDEVYNLAAQSFVPTYFLAPGSVDCRGHRDRGTTNLRSDPSDKSKNQILSSLQE